MPIQEVHQAAFPGGWIHDPTQVQLTLATLPNPLFAQAAWGLHGSGKDQTVTLYKAFKDVNKGEYIDYPAQTIGDCVSQGHGHGIDLLSAIQIVVGHSNEEFKQTATEAVYGMARVDIGGQRGSRSDGAVGAWAAKAISTLGTLSRDVVGAYDGRRAKEWGASGVPAELKAKAKDHIVKTVSLVETYADLEDAIANGYPVTVCSNQGFTMERDSEGFCQARGSWAHCCPPEAMIGGLIPKRADQVVIGDEVIGHDGRTHRVTAAMVRRHRGEMISIKSIGLPPIRLTSEHPLYVEREVSRDFVARPSRAFVGHCAAVGVSVAPVVSTERELVRGWVKAGDVREGDKLLMPMECFFPSVAERSDWVVNGDKCKNIPRSIVPDDELAWLFGLFIANGHSEPGHRVTITLPSSKVELEMRATDAFRSIGLEPTITRKPKFIRLVVNSSIVGDTFKAWFGGGDEEKRIPRFLFEGWNLEQVIAGIYSGDGDGCYLTRPRIYTTSRTLLNQLWLLLVTSGRRPAIYVCSRSKGTYANAKPLYAVNYEAYEDWSDQKMRHRTGYRDGFYVMPVKSVERTSYDGMVYNWEVEGSNSYVVDGVAVHNCMLITGIRNDSRPGACIFQSWGSSVPSGPLALDQPPNSFWADRDVVSRMLSMRDSWALSGFVGYPGQVIPDTWKWADFSLA